MLGRSELHFTFSAQLRRMVLIFTDFPTGSGSQPYALLNLCISEVSLSKLEKF